MSFKYSCIACFCTIVFIFSSADALKIITRHEWNAMPPKTVLANLKVPVPKVIIAHSASQSCSNQEKCSAQVRNLQAFHMNERNFDDIGYNFLVGGDGIIYEGRGWIKQGAHTKGYNSVSICITFIGTYTTIVPTDAQIRAAQDLIQSGVDAGYLSTDYKLYGHRQLVATESPGQKLYEEIQTWPHWSSDV